MNYIASISHMVTFSRLIYTHLNSWRSQVQKILYFSFTRNDLLYTTARRGVYRTTIRIFVNFPTYVKYNWHFAMVIYIHLEIANWTKDFAWVWCTLFPSSNLPCPNLYQNYLELSTTIQKPNFNSLFLQVKEKLSDDFCSIQKMRY